jgi:hypothetical protein
LVAWVDGETEVAPVPRTIDQETEICTGTGNGVLCYWVCRLTKNMWFVRAEYGCRQVCFIFSTGWKYESHFGICSVDTIIMCRLYEYYSVSNFRPHGYKPTTIGANLVAHTAFVLHKNFVVRS